MMTEKHTVTFEQAIQQVIRELEGPADVGDVVRRVLAIRPSTAKKPEQQVRSQIRGHPNKTWVYLDGKTVIPLRVVMRGVRFRIVLSPLEVKRGLLLFAPNFRGYAPLHALPESLTLLDAAGQPLSASPVTVRMASKSVFGEHVYDASAWDIGSWLKKAQAHAGDSLLVTIEDWSAGRFRLEHEVVGRRRFDEVDSKNRELADLLFDALERASYESILDRDAVAQAYARMADPCGYPGDHWITVVERDSRMKLFDLMIQYAESRTFFDEALGRTQVKPRALPISAAQRQQVYRFRVALKYRPSVWRRIEVQGGQTLADWDSILRDEFKHDHFDHMSGFWRKVRRGESGRFRELEVGTIAPFGDEGKGSHTHIAAIGLAVGDELKYVYDFGDWIEHTVVLEAIAEPVAGVKYPRVAAQNKPQYHDCEGCTRQGRRVRATWVCHSCSNEQGRDVLLCKDCLLAEHEGHYSDEIVY